MGHIVVTKALHLAEGEATAIDDTGMVLPVGDDHVSSTHQRRDGPQVGQHARAKDKARLLTDKVRQVLLQLVVQHQIAVQET